MNVVGMLAEHCNCSEKEVELDSGDKLGLIRGMGLGKGVREGRGRRGRKRGVVKWEKN